MIETQTLDVGQLAIKYHLITSRELAECRAALAISGDETPLARMLHDLGYIDEDELHLLRRASEHPPGRREPEAVGLARLLLQLDLCRAEDIAACRVHRRDTDQTFEQALLDLGVVTEIQLMLLLAERQQKHCRTCRRNFDVVGLRNGYRMRCPDCFTFLLTPRIDELETAAEEIFFDRDLAECFRAVAAVAVEEGFATIEQVRDALEIQASVAPRQSLPRILLELGHIAGRDARQELSRRIRDRLARRRRDRDRVLREAPIGALAVKFCLVGERAVRRALVLQSELKGDGDQVRLGEILLEERLVTRRQLRMLLEFQSTDEPSLN